MNLLTSPEVQSVLLVVSTWTVSALLLHYPEKILNLLHKYLPPGKGLSKLVVSWPDLGHRSNMDL